MTEKHTPGPWRAEGGMILAGDPVETNRGLRSKAVCQMHGTVMADECRSNALLIAEAGTVATETGLTPSQLAEQRAELLEAIQWYIESHEETPHGRTRCNCGNCDRFRAAIAKVEGKS